MYQDTLLASLDINTDPRKALSTWMTELQQHTETGSKEERKKPHTKKANHHRTT